MMPRMGGVKFGQIITISAILLIGPGGCALLGPGWHWAKPGAGEDELSWDRNQCKAKVYSGSSGAVTNETVRRMFACMESRGWSKVAD